MSYLYFSPHYMAPPLYLSLSLCFSHAPLNICAFTHVATNLELSKYTIGDMCQTYNCHDEIID